MDSFRKPRPDVPILPSRALYRKVPKRKKIIRPKGSRKRRKGKPKGRPKTTQAPFITEEQDRNRVVREIGLRQIALEQSDKSLQNERERLRLQTAVAQEEVRYRGLLFRREDIQREEDREERREERRQDIRRGLPQVIRFRETSPEGSIRSPLSEASPFPSPRRAEDKERARAFARASSESGIRLSPSSSPTIVELEQSIEARPETALLGEQGREISPRPRVIAGGGSVADQRERLLKTISITPRPEEEREELISQESRDISERAATDFSERLQELRSRQQTPLLSSPQAAAVRDKISRGILLQQEEQVGGGRPSAKPVSISVRPQSQKRPTTPERPKRRSTTPERKPRITTPEFAAARKALREDIPEPQPEPEPQSSSPQSSSPESSKTIDFDTAINPIRKEGKKITVDDLYIEVLSDVNKNLPAGKRFAVRSVPSITGTGKGNTTKFNIFKEGFSNRGDPQFTADDAVIEKALQEGKIRFTIG